MTDTATLEAGGEPGDGVEDTVLFDAERCKWVDEDGERCQNSLPVGHHPTRRYCEGHVKDGPLRRRAERARKKDTPPVTINIGGPKLGRPPKLKGDQLRVNDAATAWLGMAASVLEISGDLVCAEATKNAAPQIALQLALLSEFHPILVKILAPVEATGEALVWVSLAMAISPLILTVLTHHKVISDEAAGRIGIFTALGAVVGNAKAPEEPVEEAA